MSKQQEAGVLGGSPPENYQRFFVPQIGAPLADDLMGIAALRPGERVLDVACGTGVLAFLAAEAVGSTGTVAGLDVNPGMLAVARSNTPAGMTLDWHEASAEAMPLPDASFDVVMCQMGIQFVPDKVAALKEMRRVLTPGGRLILNVPGPTPPPLAILKDALARHVGGEPAGFVGQVFSLHDTEEVEKLIGDAGFKDVSVHAYTRTLPLSRPKEFLWQYVYSTPLAGIVAPAGKETLEALERDVVARWQEFVDNDDVLLIETRMVVATARK